MRPIIVKLARMLTDCMDAKMGLVRMDESRWEYKMLDALLTDEQAELIPRKVRMKGEDKDYELPAAIVGSGWAQLSCAYFLAQMSYPATVFGTADLIRSEPGNLRYAYYRALDDPEVI